MSADYFFITPSNYTFETFLKRLPNSISIYDLGDERFNIRGYDDIRGKEWNVWFEIWNYIENGYPTLSDCYTKEQIKMITQINNPHYFTIGAGSRWILNIITKIIGDDPLILIDNDTDAPLLWGNEFVAKIRNDEIPE
jgi:hypothetical protein